MPADGPDWRAARAEFPSLARWTYLNTATFGQMPLRAMDAVARHHERRNELACADFLTWFDDADSLRASVGKLINAEPASIAFVSSACSALGMLLNGMEWRRGDRIVTLENEFPDLIYAPMSLEPAGVEYVETSWERIAEAVTPATRAVVLSEVNYTNGFRPPLGKLAELAHGVGALLFVDGTQSAGALKVDVQASGADAYFAHGYKWLLSPPGSGFLYVRPGVSERLRPSVVGWRSHRTWRNVDKLHHGAPEFTGDAEKFEGGVLPFAALYAMQASVEMFLELTPEAIERRVMALAGALRGELRKLGARLPCDEAGHYDSPLVAASFAGREPKPIAAALKERGVIVSARHEYLRIATHLYNNEEDIERLVAGLRSAGL